MRKVTLAPILGGAIAAGVVAPSILKFYRQRGAADRLWQETVVERFEEPSTVKELTILPLIDFYTANETLLGEPGVSYLVKAGDHTVLFDVGFNRKGLNPSPLLRNMENLGVSREEIDSVVISHRHVDHTGGFKAQKARSFMLTPDDDRALPGQGLRPGGDDPPFGHGQGRDRSARDRARGVQHRPHRPLHLARGDDA